jgi:hypothetical protein
MKSTEMGGAFVFVTSVSSLVETNFTLFSVPPLHHDAFMIL